jgi:hypothetical protein
MNPSSRIFVRYHWRKLICNVSRTWSERDSRQNSSGRRQLFITVKPGEEK